MLWRQIRRNRAARGGIVSVGGSWCYAIRAKCKLGAGSTWSPREYGVDSSVPLFVRAEAVMNPPKPETHVAAEGTTRMSRDTVSITDNRTGKAYEVPIKNDTIHATDLRQIKVKGDDFGMMSYDPAFTNTALCQSKITYIDGDKGILPYRPYSIAELTQKSTYL